MEVIRPKRPYEPPKLLTYGELQKLTRGHPGGNNDGHTGTGTKIGTCWIAEALYGVDDTRTHLLRAWLNTVYVHTPTGSSVMFLYRHLGRRVAAMTRRSMLVRRTLQPLFDCGLRRAQRHYMSVAS